MIATVEKASKKFRIDLSKPLDISIPLRAGIENVNAFYIPPVTMKPFRAGAFVGDVSEGGSCNVFSISFNPHGNGTHTETVGHITKEKYPIYKCLQEYFFEARLITLEPEKQGNDRVMTLTQLEQLLNGSCPEALVIRTLPNADDKRNAQYSGTNPPYMAAAAAGYLRTLGVKHLLLDVPSIDREDDGGRLLAHHAFWNYPDRPRTDCTITELAYIRDEIADGDYLLNLQVISIDNDASPSKPLLYSLI